MNRVNDRRSYDNKDNSECYRHGGRVPDSRAMMSAGFEIEKAEGVMVPIPFVFGNSVLARALMAFNRFLVCLNPKLFGFQILIVARPRLTLATLLEGAKASTEKKIPLALARANKRLRRSA